MIVKKLRLQRGWSQEHLAQISGLSIRTIQRIEQGKKAGLESLKSLAAVFEIPITELHKEPKMDTQTALQEQNKAMLAKIKAIKKFYASLITYALVISLLFIINMFTNHDYLWVVWPALGWGIALVVRGCNAFAVFNLISPDWEERQLKKSLAKKQ